MSKIFYISAPASQTNHFDTSFKKDIPVNAVTKIIPVHFVIIRNASIHSVMNILIFLQSVV